MLHAFQHIAFFLSIVVLLYSSWNVRKHSIFGFGIILSAQIGLFYTVVLYTPYSVGSISIMFWSVAERISTLIILGMMMYSMNKRCQMLQ